MIPNCKKKCKLKFSGQLLGRPCNNLVQSPPKSQRRKNVYSRWPPPPPFSCSCSLQCCTFFIERHFIGSIPVFSRATVRTVLETPIQPKKSFAIPQNNQRIGIILYYIFPGYLLVMAVILGYRAFRMHASRHCHHWFIQWMATCSAPNQ